MELSNIIFTLLPALFYAFVVWLSTPFKSIKWTNSSLYFIFGGLSVGIVLFVHFLFPFWQNPVSEVYSLNLIFFAFVQVALLEEMSKFIVFKAVDISREKQHDWDFPITIMFYNMLVGGAFGVVENVMYGVQYGNDAIVIRSFTSLIIHMLAGIFMGYFIALGRENTEIKTYSVMSLFLKRHHKYRKLILSVFGILAATVLHGTYDYLLFGGKIENPETKILITITVAMTIAYFMGRHLSRLTVRNKKYLSDPIHDERVSKVRKKSSKRSNNRKRSL